MSVVDTVIIEPSTDQVTSNQFSSSWPATLCTSLPLGDGEGVKVQITHNGTIWQDLYLNGVLQELLPRHSMLTILGPGLFRVIKSATAQLVGVVYWRSEVDK